MTTALERGIGRRLSELRRLRRMSVRRLAEHGGLSPTTVHQIESGRTSPGLATLQALATALSIPVSAFFENGRPAAQAVLTGSTERPKVVIPGGILEHLASGLPNQRLRGLALTLERGSGTGFPPIRHPGQELVIGLDGVCVYEVDGKAFELRAGDSLLLDSTLPHRAHNPSNRPAHLLLALYAPEEEPSWLERHMSSESAGSSLSAPGEGAGTHGIPTSTCPRSGGRVAGGKSRERRRRRDAGRPAALLQRQSG